MAAVIVRNIPEATHKALKARAKAHGRSMEAEIRDILIDAAPNTAKSNNPLGTSLHELWQETGEWDLQLPPRAAPVRIVDFSGPEFGEPGDDP